MNLIKKAIGFNPKRLYIGKVGVQRANAFIDKHMYEVTDDPFFSLCTHVSMVPDDKIVLLERNLSHSVFSDKCYKKAIGKEYYGEFGKCTKDFAMVAQIISPVLPSNYHGRIKYTDAKEMEENFVKTLKL